jgi:TIR domain
VRCRITISYRRDDSLDITGRIFDRLAGHFGREAVFRDIDSIPPGADFRRHIDRVLDEADIVLAIVGPRWIGPDKEQLRLASPADPVRLEIETALRKNKPLIPVLVSRAVMPHPDVLPASLHEFVYRNAVQVDSGQDFDVHVGRLIHAIERLLPIGEERVADAAVQGGIAAIKPAPPIEPTSKPEPPVDQVTPVQVAKGTWDWVQHDVNTWMRALGDLRTVLTTHDLESDEAVLYALRFSAFSICAAILIGIPAQIIFDKTPVTTALIAAIFVLYYIVAFVFAICSKVVAVLVGSKVTLRACFVMAFFATIYWAPCRLLDYIVKSDQKVYRAMTLGENLDITKLTNAQLRIFVLSIVVAIPIYIYIAVKMVSASCYVFKVGGLRATIIVLGAASSEMAIQITVMQPVFDAVVKIELGS